MKRIITILLILLNSLGASIVINEIYYDPTGTDTGKEWIELYNNGGSSVNITGWEIDPDIGPYYTFPAFTLNANAYVVLHVNKSGSNTQTDLYTGSTSNMGNSSGVVSLWTSSTHTSATIVDYVQWGAGGQTNESKAVEAGIWTEDDYVSDVSAGCSIKYDGNGESSSDWQACSEPFAGNDDPLPIQLKSFNCSLNDQTVCVNWKTECEIECAGFYVLRSLDQTDNYEKISPLITGQGNSSQPTDYSFKDTRLKNNKTYLYKLEQLDNNGKSKIFGPVEINVGKINDTVAPNTIKLLQNYPNPFNPSTQITVQNSSHHAQHIKVHIFDASGRQVKQLYSFCDAYSSNQLLWDGTNAEHQQVASGVYFGKFNNSNTTLKMLKLE